MTLPELDTLADALGVLRAVELSVKAVRAWTPGEVRELARRGGDLRRVADAIVATAAGELQRRSAPKLGAAGLARREGARTPEELLQRETGLPGRETAHLTRVGRMTQGHELPGVGSRVVDGTVSVPAAEAIRSGLEGVTAEPELVAVAAEMLCDEARHLTPDQVRVRAREVRDALDADGVIAREELLRSRRSLKRATLPDGMKRLIWTYDPETAAVVDALYDRATSPRRGGPRFVDDVEAERARRIADDPRSTEQLASDAFLDLLRRGADAGSDALLGSGAPSVVVLVDADAIASGDGQGVLESTQQAVSLATVERLRCSGGVRTAVVGGGHVLDLGREHRLYSPAQRRALALRDGGCLWPDCERPPSWCEAHHIDRWADGGRTDTARGVLLCRFHHLLLHNGGWRITLRGRHPGEGPPGAGHRPEATERFWLEPPPGSLVPSRLLESRSRAWRDFHERRSRPPQLARQAPGSAPTVVSHPVVAATGST